MKKRIAIAACCMVFLLRGMEQEQKVKPYSIVVRNTQIFLHNTPLHAASEQVGIVGVGKKWQQKLQKTNFGDNYYIGSVECLSDPNELFLMSFTGKATYDSYITGQELWKQAQRHTIQNLILRVVEPHITTRYDYVNKKHDWYYHVQYSTDKDEMKFRGSETMVTGELAVDTALMDLSLCYTILLSEGIRNLQKRKDQRKKSIALTILGGHMGIPEGSEGPILVKAISDYIENNAFNDKKNYERIYVHIPGKEFDCYKKLFDEVIKKESTGQKIENIDSSETSTYCVVS